jgi:preprotein translocase subunit YajC
LDLLYALASPEGQQGGGIAAFLPFILIMVVIYFLMIRPQSKRQKEKKQMIDNLKKGDRIITIGGIHGSIAGFKNNGKVVILKIDKNMNITVNRSAVAGLVGNVTEEATQLDAQA